MKKAFSDGMGEKRILLCKVFGLMLAALLYRLCFSFTLGHYYLFICDKVTRETLFKFNSFFMAACMITPMLFFHHDSFKAKPVVNIEPLSLQVDS